MKFKNFFSVAFLLIITSNSAHAGLIELISNGGFETGDLSGWVVSDVGSGAWYVDNDTTTDISNRNSVGAMTGNFFAITDQNGPGAHALEQTFTVPTVFDSIILSFDMFINNAHGAIHNDGTLVHNNGNANQHARVDIMNLLAGAFSTTPADIVANVVPATGGSDAVNPYQNYSFDITALVTAGNSYKLRFAEVDNQLFFNMGIDNVSVTASTIPEPASLSIVLLGILGLLTRKQKAV